MGGVQKTNLIDIPEWFSDLESVHKVVSKAGKHVAQLSNYVNDVKEEFFNIDTDSACNQWMNFTKFISGAGIIFSVPKLINNIHSLVKATDTIEKVHYVAQSVLSAMATFNAGLNILSGLKSYGLIAKESLTWIPGVSLILYPLEFLSLETGIFDLYTAHELKNELNKEAPKSKKTDSLAKRVKNMTDACIYIAGHKKTLHKSLNIPKSAKIDAKAKSIFERLSSNDVSEQTRAVEEGEAMMKILRTRVNTKIAVHAASTAVKTATLVLSGVALFTLPSPAGPAVLGAVATINVAFWAFEKIMLGGDPFGGPGEEWHEQAAHQIRQTVHNAAKNVYNCHKAVSRQLDTNWQHFTQAANQVVHNAARNVQNCHKAVSQQIDTNWKHLTQATSQVLGCVA